MLMKKLLLIPIAGLLTFTGCKTAATTGAAATPVQDTISDYSFRKIMRDKELYAATTELVPLDTVFLTYDTLHILTKKVVGCDADMFKLMWNGAMMKSLPPQTSVKLFLQVEPDCKERHYFHLTYNVKPLQLKRDTVAPIVSDTIAIDTVNRKKVILRVGGYKHSVQYLY